MKHVWSVTIGHNHLEGFAKTLIDVILFFFQLRQKILEAHANVKDLNLLEAKMNFKRCDVFNFEPKHYHILNFKM